MKRAHLRGGMIAFLVPMSLTATSVALLAATDEWVADASKAVFPLHRAVGRLYGKAFRVDLAKISLHYTSSGKIGDPPSKQPEHGGAVLTLQEGKEGNPTTYYMIFLVTRPGKTVKADRRYLLRLSPHNGPRTDARRSPPVLPTCRRSTPHC